MNMMSRDTERAVLRTSTAITKLMGNFDAASDNDIVSAIDSKMSLATVADSAGHQHRLDAGRMLVQLRDRIEARGENWWKWHDKNFARCRRDSAKLIALAQATDPREAVKQERERNRQHKAAQRKREADVSPIAKIVKLIETLTDQERNELRATCEEKFSW